MESRQDENRLKAYFGFARKKHCLYVGRKLDERLERGKIRLVVFTPTCLDKNREKRESHFKDNKDLSFIRYGGEMSLNLVIGYEKVSAIGISDPHLAKAIKETLEGENSKEENHVEENQKQ